MKNKVDRLRKVQVNIGRFHFHLDLLGIIAFIALGLCSWSLAAVNVSINKEHKDRAALESAILDARYHDCLSGNTTRKALTDVVSAQNKLLSSKEAQKLILKLELPASVLKQSDEVREFELRALAPKNCNIYTNQANPKRGK